MHHCRIDESVKELSFPINQKEHELFIQHLPNVTAEGFFLTEMNECKLESGMFSRLTVAIAALTNAVSHFK